jgi:hypothetical protein
MPIPVTANSLRDAMLSANALGQKVALEIGDEAYRRLHEHE